MQNGVIDHTLKGPQWSNGLIYGTIRVAILSVNRVYEKTDQGSTGRFNKKLISLKGIVKTTAALTFWLVGVPMERKQTETNFIEGLFLKNFSKQA